MSRVPERLEYRQSFVESVGMKVLDLGETDRDTGICFAAQRELQLRGKPGQRLVQIIAVDEHRASGCEGGADLN